MRRVLPLLPLLLLGCSDDAPAAGAPDATSPVDAAADAPSDSSPSPDLPVARPVIDQGDPMPFAMPDWRVGFLPQGAPDEVVPAIEDGSFTAPVTEAAWSIDWSDPEPGTDGQLTTGSRRGVVYAAARIERPAGRYLFAQAETALALYVDRAVLPGDVYASGRIRVPLPVREGGSTVLVRSAATRGALRVKLFQTADEVYLNTADLTAPDLAVGEREERFVGLAVLNLTDAPALGVTARVEAGDDWEPTEIAIPSLPAGAVTQVPFRLMPRRAPTEAGRMVPVTLRIDSASLRASYRRTIQLATVAADATRRVTFRSRIDRSAQYFGVVPPRPYDASRRYGMALTLHGAGVEGIGQAQAYSPKSDLWIVAPTNRRPFGFDWEQWGRLDGVEILDDAMARYRVDPTRVYLTGHSMGGHGTWQLGAHHTGRFAAIGPSAGWGSFQSYTGAAAPRGAFARSQASSNTQGYLSNLTHRGIYGIHGTADDNVPIREMRSLTAAARMFTMDVQTHEQPGAGHWWDGDASAGADCVDWPPLFEFFRTRTVDPTETRFTFTSPGPWVNPRHSFVSLRSATDPSADLRVVSSREGGTVTLTATNVRSMVLDGHALRAAGVTAVVVDGRRMEVPDADLPIGPQEGKRPGTHGPFNEALQQPFCFVYPDAGPAVWREYAAYLVSSWAVTGNGYGCALPLSAVDATVRDGHVLVYLGLGADVVRPTVDARWSDAALTLGGASHPDAAMVVVFPERPDRLGAAIVTTAGSERLLYRFMPFSSQFAAPDAMVFSAQGVRAAGFFDGVWMNFRAL